jgi:Zn-dependent peptidase ImmA (M78 family)
MPARRAQERAEQLRHELGLGSGFVDVFDVLRQRGIEVYRRPLQGAGLEGSLTIRDGVAFVFVNSAGSLTRQRMTAAHELGHFELGQRHNGTEILEGRPSLEDESEEWDAYRFARFFLMDEQGVRQLCADITEEDERVAAVAHRFVVSPKAVVLHLAELGLIKPATKRRLVQSFDEGLRPSAFLYRYGFHMADLSETVEALDPGHISRALQAFAAGEISFPALADTLQLAPDKAEAVAIDAGLGPRDPAPADAG